MLTEFYAHLARHAEENRRAAEQGRAWMAPTTDEQIWAAYPSSTHGMPTGGTGWRAWCQHEGIASPDVPIVAHAALHSLQPHRAQLIVAVEEAYRGRGYGTELALRAIEWAAGHGVDWIDGLAMATNAGVLRFDKRLGFKVLGVVPDHTRLLGHSYAVAILAMPIHRQESPGGNPQ